MVSSASDYVFVTNLDNIKINGEIMPLRNGDHKRDLRGEDIAFLAEAANELIHVLGVRPGFMATISMDDTRLHAERPNAIARMFQKMGNPASGYFASGSPGNMSSFDGSAPIPFSFADYFSPHHVAFTPKADPEKFYSGAPVELEHIEDLFEDSQKIKSTVFFGGLPANNLSYSRAEGGENPPGAVDDLFTYYVDNSYFPQAHGAKKGGWSQSKLTGGDYAQDKHDYGISFNAIAFCCFLTSVYDSYGVSPSESRFWTDVRRVPVALSGGRLHISASDIGNLAESIATGHQSKLPFAPIEGDYHNQFIRCSYGGMALQLLRGNHTLY